jgi:hypothetical protein
MVFDWTRLSVFIFWRDEYENYYLIIFLIIINNTLINTY